MQTSANKFLELSFLQGGKEMGKLIRSFDWHKTSLGEISEWPQSLLTTLNIILNSRFPMFLWWGKELICFYNDAYRPSLGNDGKHPSILGTPAKEAWPEIWDIIKPLIDQVLSGEGATWNEDQLVPIYRNGRIEDVYWTFSYSPVNDDSGKVGGILVTCTETTEKVITLHRLEETNHQLQFAIEATELGTWDYNPLTNKFTANDRLKKWFGLPETGEIDFSYVIEIIAEADKQRVVESIEKALTYSSGGKYDSVYSIVHPGTKKEMIVHAKGRAWFNDEKIAYRFNGTLEDVTEQVTARNRIEKSEEKLNIVIEASELGTWELNLKTKEVHYSDRYLAILGYPERVELTHEQILKHLHPADLALREGAFRKAFSTGVLHYESRIIWNDQSIHWMEGKGKVFYHDNHEPAYLLGTIRDITEEKYYQQGLEERERKFRLLADSMPQHIWTADTEGYLNYYNESVYRYTGRTPEQVSREGWLQIVHPDDREENMIQWMKSINTGEAFLFEHRFLRHDGEYRWQLSRALPVKDDEGNIQMWVGTSTDIHEIKQHEQQKDDFIKMASHELKTPVTTIKGYIQLLLDSHANSKDVFLTNSLSVIDKQISKLTKLITDLLDVTKIETGSLQLNLETFPVSELIAEIIKDIQSTTIKHTIIPNLEADILITADKDRIGQALINLLNNAIKYSPNADKVIIKTEQARGRLIVSVRDFGIGIPAGDHDKVFERFFRVEGKDEKTFPGFGIGLFIVKEIIQMHQGQLWIESEKNKGSTFYFSLPVSV